MFWYFGLKVAWFVILSKYLWLFCYSIQIFLLPLQRDSGQHRFVPTQHGLIKKLIRLWQDQRKSSRLKSLCESDWRNWKEVEKPRAFDPRGQSDVDPRKIFYFDPSKVLTGGVIFGSSQEWRDTCIVHGQQTQLKISVVREAISLTLHHLDLCHKWMEKGDNPLSL